MKPQRAEGLPMVVGLGEILWDCLPSGRRLGGAPANFAYCSHLLGNRAVVASRIGRDELGLEIRQSLARAGMPHEFLQDDAVHPTGTVCVHLDREGQPGYEISQPAAWDFLEWSESWKTLARSADAVAFGTLAQRSEASRRSIWSFLEQTRPGSLRVFDINLRQNFYSAQLLQASFERADVVKLNQEELSRVQQLLETAGENDVSVCRNWIETFDLRLICVTRGANGSLLCGRRRFDEHPGFRIAVKDTVGAGDAFTAGLVHSYLRGGTLAELNRSANRMGAWVASHSGGMPKSSEPELERALAEIQ
jgi:fructokinase